MSESCTQSIASCNSTTFAALNRSIFLRLYSQPRNPIIFRKSFSCTITATAISNANSLKYSASRSRNLFARISPVKKDNDVVQVLDQWIAEGREVHSLELRRIIRDLRSRKRFSKALKVSVWISRSHVFSMSPSDYAVHLDLIGALRGCKAAENYFNVLNVKYKNEKTYGALLTCYVRES